MSPRTNTFCEVLVLSCEVLMGDKTLESFFNYALAMANSYVCGCRKDGLKKGEPSQKKLTQHSIVHALVEYLP